MKILLVDDDADLRVAVTGALAAESYDVDTASDGAEGSRMALSDRYDMVILDCLMPKKNGTVVCEEMRKAGIPTPILFLSVVDDARKKADILDLGADDFLEKPFSAAELSARMRAILRRSPSSAQRSIARIGPVTLDRARQTVVVAGKMTYLTRMEYILLQYLMDNKGAILSHDMITERVYGAEDSHFSNVIESHIANLRRKLRRGGSIIRTIVGRGYMADDAEA